MRAALDGLWVDGTEQRRRRRQPRAPAPAPAPAPASATDRAGADVWALVSEFLDPCGLLAVQAVSRSAREASSNEELWRPLCLRHCPEVAELLGDDADMVRAAYGSWRQAFVQLCPAAPRLLQDLS